jgi:hypothetical protein
MKMNIVTNMKMNMDMDIVMDMYRNDEMDMNPDTRTDKDIGILCHTGRPTFKSSSRASLVLVAP